MSSKKPPPFGNIQQTSTPNFKFSKKTNKSATQSTGSLSSLNLTSICSLSQQPSSYNNSTEKTVSIGTTVSTKLLKADLDWTYANYLNALLEKKVIENSTTKKKQDLLDQLALEKDFLFSKQLSLLNRKEKFAEQTVAKQLNSLYQNLLPNIAIFEEILSKNKFEKKILSLCSNLEEESNKLFTKNVEPLTTQEDYEEFENCVDECLRVCQNFVRKYQKLINQAIENSTSVNEYNKSCVKLEEKLLELSSLQKQNAVHLLQQTSKGFSNKFFSF